MKKRVVLFLILVISIASISLTSASFELSNQSIERTYGPKNNLKGWINISFSEESSDSKITASSGFEGSIDLIDFLNANNADYECIPKDCESSYTASNPQTTKSFSLNHNQEKVYGFVLTGTDVGVTSLSFNVSTSNSQSCSNPLEIDILNDKDIEWKSKSVSNNFGCAYKEGTGCFNSSEQLSEVSIGTKPFCEKIFLLATEKFQLGAWVKKRTSTSLLTMSLYDLYNNELTTCDLPEPSNEGREVACEIEFSNPKMQEYYVCIRAEEQTDYIMKTESKNSCGFWAEPGEQTSYHDYYIFAKGARFSNIGTFSFNQDEYEAQGNEGNLADYADNYLEKYYRNCTGKCVIPVKFKANTNLEIVISNLTLYYSTDAGPSATPATKIYDATTKAAKISSDFQILELSETNISVPDDYGSHDLQLYLDGEEIFPDEIEIEVLKIPMIENIVPNIAPAAVPTKFTASVTSPSKSNISSYEWSFGDGENDTTNVNYVTHTYSSIDDYSLILTVTDARGFVASKEFIIKVESPEKRINSTITEYNKRLNNLSIELASMAEWHKNLMKEKIDLDLLKEEVDKLEIDYSSASDDEYVEIMEKLMELRVPYSIKTSSQGDLIFFVVPEGIEPSYFEELGAGSYDEANKEGYQEAIVSWADNLDLKLEFKYLSAYYDDSTEEIIGVFNFKINSIEEIDELYVLIQAVNVLFKETLNTKEFSDATGVSLTDVSSKNVEFAVLDVGLEELELYLSPKFSQLEIEERIEACDFDGKCEEGEDWKNCRSDCKPWGIALIFLVVVIFVGLVGYILLQWWYKMKYERHLFKTKTDLFNILNFIKNGENSGLTDSEIRTKLKNAGWAGEQISYAFKKIRGKGIMPFDFLKLFSKFKRQELETKAVSGGNIPITFRLQKS